MVVSVCILHDQPCRLTKEPPTIGMRSHHRTITRQRQPDRLIKAVHRVSRKHTRAAATRRARRPLHSFHFRILSRSVCREHHRIDQIERTVAESSRLHRSTGDEHSRYIESHGGHKHARRNLVAIADADHGVGLVRLHHVLDAVGDEVA